MSYPTSAAEVLSSIGAAGSRLDHIGACEAGAGNISVAVREKPADLGDVFEQSSRIDLPVPVPGLAGWTVFVTGSGCRLRETESSPQATICAVVIDDDGASGEWRTSAEASFTRPTSEFNSHLGVHEDQALTRGVRFQAVIHAQPPYLVTLSHIPALRNDRDLNRAILRWEPETIVQVPAGIKVLDFMVPGGEELGRSNVESLRDHQIVLWSKHGVMVRSDHSALSAVDTIEYVETGAMYEYRNLAIGGLGEGLHHSELTRVTAAFCVETDLL